MHTVSTPLPSDLELLHNRLQRYSANAANAYAANTLKAWAADTKVYWSWCHKHGHVPLPTAPEALATFVHIAGATRTVATIRRYLASIGALHRAAQLPDPTKEQVVILALRTLQRTKAVAGVGRQRQAAPLNLDIFEAGFSRLGNRTIDHFTRALVSVAFECLCRAEDLIRFDVEHLEVLNDGSGRILITQGKTDQAGVGKIMYVSGTTVMYLHAWLACKPHHLGPLFRPVTKSGSVGEERVSYMVLTPLQTRR